MYSINFILKLLSVITNLSISLNLYAAVDINPETVEFCKKNTLKTWVASKYHSDQLLMSRLQIITSFFVPQNPLAARQLTLNIHTSEKDIIANGNRDYGFTHPTIASVELPFLQFVHEKSRARSISTLEIGMARGYVSLKVPFAFEKEGLHYVNDIHENIFKDFNTTIGKFYSALNQKDNIRRVQGDCLKILEQHPEYRGRFTAIYAQNVEHFFNPQQHQEFLSIISELLTEGGKAFLSSNTFQFGMDKTNPLRVIYDAQRNNKECIYKGFVEYTQEYGTIEDYSGDYQPIYSEVTIPENNSNTFTKFPQSSKERERIKVGNNFHEVVYFKRRLAMNFFSPTIYKEAISKISTLKSEEAFFINKMGERHDKWEDKLRYAAVILRKDSSAS